MKINKKRLQKDIENMSKFGGLDNGGVTRLAFTKIDLEAREYLRKEMEACNLKVNIDSFGNMRGRREGKTDYPPVVIGSHLDTVPNGGNYDGVIGVLGALEVIRVLNEQQIITKRPVEVINFSCEESSRFGTGTLGSKVLAGKITEENLRKLKDRDGLSLYEVLEKEGFQPEKITEAKLNKGDVFAFIEMHIEQGPVLERQKCDVGIVTAIAAPTRLKVIIEGRADHSGNTPMDMRKDALVVASELILAVERIAKSEAGEKTVGTVGYVLVEPGVMNVVPGKVELGIDIRDINNDDKDKAVNKVIQFIEKLVETKGVKINYTFLSNERPVILSSKIIDCLETEAKKLGLNYIKMPSGAGHDAMNMTYITEVGMIFVPSVNGISHNIKEFTYLDDIVKGTELLLKATLSLANEGCD